MSPSNPRVVVLSTHLDDAVLSLGAWIRKLTRTGTEVEILTVLGGDPDSDAEAGWWDRDGGFATEGAAAKGRRAEDERACALVGARRTVLPFGDQTYDRGAGDDEIWSQIAPRLADAGVVLVPGTPLMHPDHRWLARLALGRDLPGRVGLYVEQPYVVLPHVRWWRWSWRPQAGEPIRDLVPGALEWTVVRSTGADRRAKGRACRAYRTQIPLLGRRPPVLWRMRLYETLRGGESIAWLSR
jgi:LmbE family N-acetylglucosaminyl deacetylase